jgi:hypothetical protein
MTVDLLRTGGGTPILTGAGDWQWVVSIDGNATGAMEAALDFIATGGTDPLVGAAANNGTDWDHQVPTDNPTGFGDFSWLPDDINGRAEGLDVNTTLGELQAAFGSADLSADSEYIIITTNGPNTTNSLSSTVQVGGAYTTDTGRIALGTDNYDGYAGSVTATALAGDANLSGDVDGADYNALLVGFNPGPDIWTGGDFNGSGVTDGADYNILLVHFPDPAITIATPLVVTGTLAGAGAGSGSAAVPEPASAVLMLMAGAMLLVARIRRR